MIKRYTPIMLLGLVLLAGAVGFAQLYGIRLNQGDGFPAYSSLRADPLGLRAFYDSLALLPGVSIARRFEPLEKMAALPPRVLVVAGVSRRGWETTARKEFVALDDAVRAGSRLVIGLQAQSRRETESTDEKARPRNGQTSGKSKQRNPVASDKNDDEETPSKEPPVDLKTEWGIALQEQSLPEIARRTADAPGDLPTSLTMKSAVGFEISPLIPWEVLYRAEGTPVLVELRHGRGSIVVCNDSYFISNEALQRERKTALLAWLIGTNTRIEFDESHLGIAQEIGAAGLARRYGLAGAFGTFLLFALLFAWHRLALFIPQAEENQEVSLAYNRTAGLEALLKRALPAPELIATCVTEWERTARPAEVARLRTALAALPANANPADAYNALLAKLRHH